MPKVNLLPWREERRKQRERKFYKLLAVSAITAAAAVTATGYFTNALLLFQQQRNQILQQEITALNMKLGEIQDIQNKRNELLARMGIIERLQANRNATVHFFNELTTITPDGVNLSAITQQEQQVDITGIAESNARISHLMENINRSTLFHSPELKIIRTYQAKEFQRRSRFSLSFGITETPAISKPIRKPSAQ